MIRNLLLKEFIQRCNKGENTLLSPLGYEIVIHFLKETMIGELKKELMNLDPSNQLEDLFLKIAKIKKSYQNFDAHLRIEHSKLIQLLEEGMEDVVNLDALDLKHEVSNDFRRKFRIISKISLVDKWKYRFEVPTEKYLLFKDENHKSIPLKSIRQFTKNGRNQTKYFQNGDLEGVQVPLKSEGLVLEIYKPIKSNFEDFIQSINAEKLKKLSEDFFLPSYLEVYLPEYVVKSFDEYQKKDGFLGLEKLFKFSWDFSKLFASTDLMFIEKIMQENELEVNIEGIKATSETIFEGGVTGIPKMDEYLVFEADQPFLFLLRDWQHDLLFYIGTFRNPGPELSLGKESIEVEYLTGIKRLKYFLPKVYQISMRGRVFLCMLFLKDYISTQDIDTSWLDKVKEDIYTLLLSDNEAIRLKLSNLDLSGHNLTGYFWGNDYFPKEEIIQLDAAYPIISEVISSICRQIKYSSPEDEFAVQLSFNIVKRAINLMISKTNSVIDLNPMDAFIKEKEPNQPGRLLSREEVEQIVF